MRPWVAWGLLIYSLTVSQFFQASFTGRLASCAGVAAEWVPLSLQLWISTHFHGIVVSFIVICHQTVGKESEGWRTAFGSSESQRSQNRKVGESWTCKHRNLMRKIMIKGRWANQNDTGWSDKKVCRDWRKVKGTVEHVQYLCP